MSLPICPHLIGKLARIYKYVRPNGRRPAHDFLTEIDPKMRKKFAGQFDALTKMGANYVNNQRFIPLHKDGKPLWEFKEHDHRLYCLRTVEPPNVIVVVLFSGWVKQKVGQTDKEDREIERAKFIYEEFIAEEKKEKTL